MKVAIVIPPRQKGSKLPLDALYVAAVLTADHNEVQMIDLTHSPVIPKEKFRIDTKLFWIFSNGNYNRAMQVKGFLPTINTTIISGSDPTLMPEIMIKSGWDYVLTGEPELVACGLVSKVFRRGIINCQLPAELDVFPFPSRAIVKMSDYYGVINHDSVADIQASRSWKKPRSRSIGSVVEEMKDLTKNYRFTNFRIIDSYFFMNQENLVRFCTEIVPLKYTVEIEVPIDVLNLDTIPSLLSMSGVTKVKLMEPTDNRDYSKLIVRLKENAIELSGWKPPKPKSTTNS